MDFETVVRAIQRGNETSTGVGPAFISVANVL